MYWLMICIGIAILEMMSLTAFHLIGSTIDVKGFLYEPFVLLLIGYALLVIGGIGALDNDIMNARHKNRSHTKNRNVKDKGY
ncbi:MAG: hypothetical protein NPIRA04_36540 [Nitrospirales bacterium]|nr:MAG: hypothetical protein NPIRA04_36540 [Nitrospirales bacterium]